MKSRCLQYFRCENHDLEVPNVENSSQKSLKKLHRNPPKNQTIFKQIPYQNCGIQKIPIYGKIQSQPDVGAVVGGAVLGGIIGKAVTKKDKGAAVGALIGGAIANENQKTKMTSGIVGYENRQRCQTKFKNFPKEEVVYSYSTITFVLDGQEQTVEFQKSQQPIR